MKQTNIFSYVKWNNNNSGGVDGSEQCSSKVKEAPRRSEPNVIQLGKLENGTTLTWDAVPFGGWPKSECSRYIQEMQEQTSHLISCILTSVITVVFAEVSNNEIYDFLTSNSWFSNFC